MSLRYFVFLIFSEIPVVSISNVFLISTKILLLFLTVDTGGCLHFRIYLALTKYLRIIELKFYIYIYMQMQIFSSILEDIDFMDIYLAFRQSFNSYHSSFIIPDK